MTTYTLPSDGEYTFDDAYNYNDHCLNFQGVDGQVVVTARPPGSDVFHSVPNGTIDIANPHMLRFTGNADEYKFVLTGASAPVTVTSSHTVHGNGINYQAAEMGAGPSQQMRDNLEAITTQGFSEANSKAGSQYELTTRLSNIVSATPQFIGFETGDLPVIVKQRDVFGGFVDATFDVFSGAEYSGGTPIQAFNNNDLVVRPTLSNIVLAPSVTVTGNQFGPTTHLLGSTGVGNSLIRTFGPAAGEKVLAPNTKYLIRVSNLDVSAIGVLSIRIYYYEGPLFAPSF